MFNWFQQQAKDLVSTSAIQTGQPISSDLNVSSSSISAKKKKVDEEGEVMEEGFVCVGQSSFYSGVEQPSVPFSYLPSPSHSGVVDQSAYQSPFGMYPHLPSPSAYSNSNYQSPSATNASSSDPIHEGLKYVPFVLRSDLRPKAPVIYNPHLESMRSERNHVDWTQYEYDFQLERSVIREVRQYNANR